MNAFIFLNLINKGGYFILLLLCLIRVYLDILDGSIARRCNMKSNFGLLYDFIGDYIVSFGISLIVLYSIYKNGKINRVLSLAIVLIIFLIFIQFLNGLLERINNMNKKNYSTKDIQKKSGIKDKFDKIITDNTVILFPLFIFGAKCFINYLST